MQYSPQSVECHLDNGKLEVSETPEVYSEQEDTDTRVIMYVNYAVEAGSNLP